MVDEIMVALVAFLVLACGLFFPAIWDFLVVYFRPGGKANEQDQLENRERNNGETGGYAKCPQRKSQQNQQKRAKAGKKRRRRQATGPGKRRGRAAARKRRAANRRRARGRADPAGRKTSGEPKATVKKTARAAKGSKGQAAPPHPQST
jgi:hypothetical protein